MNGGAFVLQLLIAVVVPPPNIGPRSIDIRGWFRHDLQRH